MLRLERMLVPAPSVWFALLLVLNWSGPISAYPLLSLATNAMPIEFIVGGMAALLFRHVNRLIERPEMTVSRRWRASVFQKKAPGTVPERRVMSSVR